MSRFNPRWVYLLTLPSGQTIAYHSLEAVGADPSTGLGVCAATLRNKRHAAGHQWPLKIRGFRLDYQQLRTLASVTI